MRRLATLIAAAVTVASCAGGRQAPDVSPEPSQVGVVETPQAPAVTDTLALADSVTAETPAQAQPDTMAAVEAIEPDRIEPPAGDVAIPDTARAVAPEPVRETRCSFAMVSPEGRAERSFAYPDVIIAHDPFVVDCDDGTHLTANSGEYNQRTGEVFLSGNVYYADPGRTLTSSEATYNSATGYLFAEGNVDFRDRERGTTLRGPDLEYFRATEENPIARMTATGRPTVTIAPDPEADSDAPTELVANRIETLGDETLMAYGAVVITRPDLEANADEASHNSGTGDLELRQNAMVRSDDYRLAARLIVTRMIENVLEFLHATGSARLDGDELQVSGGELHIFFEGEQVNRAIALAEIEDDAVRQATALSEGFRMDADSLDASFIEGRLDRVDAVGGARAETIDTTAVIPESLLALADTAAADGTGLPVAPDTMVADSVTAAMPGDARPDSIVADSTEPPTQLDLLVDAFSSDWIRGDTIIGYFIPRPAETPPDDPGAEIIVVPNPDDSRSGERTEVDLERLVAIGHAQSLYRLAGEGDAPGEKRRLNFLVGDRIELVMLDGELEVAEVSGLEYGMYLEPEARGTADSADGVTEVELEAGADAEPTPADSPQEPIADGF